MSELEAELADMELNSGNCEQTEPTTDRETKHPSRQYRSIPCLYCVREILECTHVQSAPINSTKEFATVFGSIWQGVELRAAFNIGSQWSALN